MEGRDVPDDMIGRQDKKPGGWLMPGDESGGCCDGRSCVPTAGFKQDGEWDDADRTQLLGNGEAMLFLANDNWWLPFRAA